MIKQYLWKSFLVVYLGVLLFHVFETGLTLRMLPFLVLGFVIALISHRTSHVISLLFLVAHMTIEAIEYSLYGTSFTIGVLLWIAIHVGMDGVFLWGEVKRHFFGVRYQMWSSIALGVLCVYFFVPSIPLVGETLEHSPSLIEFIVIGGVMGCVLSHIIPHKHTQA